jgi:hypothetical protein
MEPSLPEEPDAATPARRRSRRERRLRSKIDPGDRFVSWGRGWVSRDGRLRAVLAARTYDYVVLSDRQLYLVTTGFFTRMPRRVVYAAVLDRLRITERSDKRGRFLQVASLEQRPHVVQLRGNRRNNLLADAMLEATSRKQPPTAEPSE